MQTVVLDNPRAGSAGDIADHFTACNGDIVSKTNVADTAAVVFGTMVADDGQPLAANDDVLGGIAVRAHSYVDPEELVAVSPLTEKTGLKPGATFGCGRTGRYHVLIEDDVELGDEVHVRAVAGAGEIKGAFRPVKDGTDTINCSDFCKWVEAGEVDGDTGFGTAVLEVTMPMAALATADS